MSVHPAISKKIKRMDADGFKEWAIAKDCKVTLEQVKRVLYKEPAAKRRKARRKKSRRKKKRVYTAEDRQAEYKQREVERLILEGYDEASIRLVFGT